MVNMGQEPLLLRVSTVEALINSITKEILDCKWEPGEQIREAVLADKYGVSRHSVREALAVLVKQGLLKKEANKGVFIPMFSAEDIMDLYRARVVFEVEAVRLLAQKGVVSDEIYESLEGFKMQKQDDPWSNIIEMDVKFHKTIVDSIGSPRISNLFSSLLTEFRLINRQPRTYKPVAEVYEKHKLLVDTIKAKDVEKAAVMIRTHLMESAEFHISEFK